MCENIRNLLIYCTLELIVVIVLEFVILSLFTPALELFNTGKCAGNLITSSYDGGGATTVELIL